MKKKHEQMYARGGVLLNRKGIIPAFVMTLTILIMLISIGYAALNQNLNISGEAFLRAKDNIRISRVELSDTKDEGYETYSPEYSKRTTKMYTTLPKDTSSVTYTVKVTNSTGIKYKVDSIEIDNTNSNVSCTPSIEVNSILEDGITEFTVTANYENEISQDTNLNACDIKYEFVPLDVIPPTLTVQLVKDNGNTKTIKITAIDEVDGSGLSPDNIYKYYLSTSETELLGGIWKEYVNSTEFEISGDTEARYLWIYPVRDRAGNISGGNSSIEPYSVGKYIFIDDVPTLYNVIAKEALTDGVAKLYTGQHNDAYDESGTKKIFHFYGADDNKGAEVLTKNNVIFGGFCWQMIRTTDTGGTELIYNGKLNEETEISPITESEYNVTSNDANYPYTYDNSENTWTSTMKKDKSSGTIIFNIKTSGKYYLKYKISSEVGYDKATYYKNDVQVGQSSGEKEGTINIGNITPSDVIKVVYTKDDAVSSGNDNVSFSIGKSISEVKYTCSNTYDDQQIGNSLYNENYNSPAYLGYMYNTIYQSKYTNINTEYTLHPNNNLNIDYWYGDSITYDTTTGKYSLVNPYKVTNESDFESLKRRYTIGKISDTYTSDVVYWIGGVSGSSYYRIPLYGGNTIDHYNDVYTYGETYIKNEDETYTINDPSTLERIDYYDNYSVLTGKYVCKNAVNNICNNVLYIPTTNNYSFTWVSSEYEYLFASDYTYNDGKYYLNNDSVSVWNIGNIDEKDKINSAHYTCINKTGVCEKIAYVYYVSDTNFYYIELQNGMGVKDALEEMLEADNVNQIDSKLKNTIDNWYQENMTEYTKYLEDTVFCNDRSIANYGGWNPNGGSVNKNWLMLSGNWISSGDLYCKNITDRFSMTNEKAMLTYPVGLTTAREMYLLGSDNMRKTGTNYWVSSPQYYGINRAYVYFISNVGKFAGSYNLVASNYGVRPSVSLAPGTKYSKGTGSTTDPYIVDLASPTITYETLTDGEREKIVKIIASDDSELASDNKYKYYLSTSDAMLSGGEWKDYTPSELVTLTGENETKYLWVYPIMDNAQNINDGKTDINTPYVLATVTFKDKFYLYNILQKEYASGSGLAKLYSGQHSDTYNETGTENIYYFYGADSTASQNIANKNNLLFAGFCWQMIRTTDTKGTKLIYNGVPKETDGKKMCTNSDTEQIIGTSKYNEDSYQKPMYAGYMYGTDVEDFATNTNNSIIKNYIENWYAANMTPYTKYLEDTVFCNDRNVIRTKRSEIWWTNTRQTTAVTNLYCTNVTDRFSVSNSSAKLTYPVGMISLPEINILGNTTLTKTSDYWTISPDYYWEDSSSVLIRYVSKTYVLQDGKDPSSETGVRPVISISSSVEYSSGTGSATDPYIVDLESPSITVDTLKDERNQKTVKITVSDDSNLSIDNQYKYYLSTSNTTLAGGEWKDYTPGEIITLTGENETRYLWIYPVKDIAGNINDGKNDINTPYVVASYKFTSLPPVINVTTTNVSNTQKNVVINITTQGSTLASDNKYQYCLSTLSTSVSGCTWKDYTNGTSFTVTGTNGYYYLWIYAISDNAGNVGDNRNKNEAYMKESIILYSYSRDFNYINGESTFNVTVPGYYKLEVWGAQGGSASSSYVGGYGGYSSGTYKASSGETLYLNVGGAGSTTANGIVAGGYNGGGNASGITRYTIVYNVGSGGGATSIAKVSGTLRNLTASNLPNILIVAGGGGGSNTDSGTISYSTNGGSGGGINGTNGRAYESSIAVGGSQTSAGTAGGFGYGGSATGGIYTGGGGGLYGGGLNAHDNAGAAGGSCYIGNSLLTNKVMYCYNCATSAEQSTKTVSTTCTSSQAASNCSKQGNGYARITFIST